MAKKLSERLKGAGEKIFLGLGLSVFIISCGAFAVLAGRDTRREVKVDGYDIIADDYGHSRTVIIKDSSSRLTCIPSVIAEDYENDGRFDTIEFNLVPKGHPLEQFESLQRLEEVYQKAMGRR